MAKFGLIFVNSMSRMANNCLAKKVPFCFISKDYDFKYVLFLFFFSLHLKFDLTYPISNMYNNGVLTEKESFIFVLCYCILTPFLQTCLFSSVYAFFFSNLLNLNVKGNVNCCY